MSLALMIGVIFIDSSMSWRWIDSWPKLDVAPWHLAEAAEVDAALVRDVLADGDLGLLVVGGQDVGARQHVDVGRLGEGLEQHRVGRDRGADQLLRVCGRIGPIRPLMRPVAEASESTAAAT
jgi:hypothetical protein